MRKYLFLIVVMSLFACNHKTLKQGFVLPEKTEINEVIKAVIEQDSLSLSDSPLDSNLKKLKVVFVRPDKNGVPPMPNYDVFYIRYQLPLSTNGEALFTKKDSTYLLFQNNGLKTANLNQSSSPLMKLTDTLEIKNNNTTENGLPKFGGNCHYNFTIPIFSLDHNMAYVQQSMLCNVIGGGSTGIYLSKINGKWKMVKKAQLWIS